MKFETSRTRLSTAHGLIGRLFLLALAFSLLVLPLRNTAYAQTGQATFSKPQLISNTKKYRDTGLPSAKGRSGSATLTARALLGKEGQTNIEMTTGTLDEATTAPGQIVKAQLRPINNKGETKYTRNYTGLTGGGRFAATVNDLRRAQQLQVQANVTGIDPNRTDVVTVVETVKLRPDLNAAYITAPTKAIVNTNVSFSVVVRELNGDVGAKANVVLYVDGREVDRANNVWVDANGIVSAAFTHNFTSEGVKQLEAKVERVTPGDYDPSDNSVTRSIEIVPPTVKLSYYASAADLSWDANYTSEYEYNYRDEVSNASDSQTYSYGSKGHTQDVSFYGWSNVAAVSFPLDASITELNDGVAVHSTTFPGVSADYSYVSDYGPYTYTSNSLYRQDNTTGYYFQLGSYSVSAPEQGYSTKFTQVSYSRHAGEVTYHSAGIYRTYYAYQGEVIYDDSYSFNYNSSEAVGIFTPFGTQYGFNVSVTGANGVVLSATPNMSLEFSEYTAPEDFCWSYTYEFSSGRNCYRGSYTTRNKLGYASEYNE
ncbi:MAG TPA: hypothetical protein VF658_05355 [Pyrinomonadaceae bacterium]|jgi:hypothetical protein